LVFVERSTQIETIKAAAFRIFFILKPSGKWEMQVDVNPAKIS
jgi:hypothetical protein